MTLATVTVRVAFASNPWEAAPTWADVSHDVLSFKIQRGRFHELDRMEAGTASIVLDNASANYWPDNAAGLYYGNVRPGKRVNIRATYMAVIYDIYTGYVEAYSPGWKTGGGLGSTMTIDCADEVKPMSRLLINNAGYAQELSGARVNNVIDYYVPYPEKDIDAGQSLMQATGALANINAMDHLFTVQESELGLFWIRGDGYVVFQDRHARMNAPYTISQATFGDTPGEMKYYALELSYDDQYLYNDIRITRVGGIEQVAGDPTSVLRYGTRSLSRTALLMTNDAEALDQANYLLSRFKDPALRVKNITILPQADPVNLWPKVLGYEISTRITIKLTQASINADYHIEGIGHDVDAATGVWKTRWELSNADAQTYWILGTSALDYTTRLAY